MQFCFILEANALAAQEKVLEIASTLGVTITVGVAHQFDIAKAGLMSLTLKTYISEADLSLSLFI